MSENIKIMIDNELIELQGKELTDFLSERDQDHQRFLAEKAAKAADAQAKSEAKQTAVAKLAALGLTADDVKALGL